MCDVIKNKILKMTHFGDWLCVYPQIKIQFIYED